MQQNIVKKGGGIRQKWDTQDMSRAVMSVKNGDYSQLQASKIYNVPRQTLQRYLRKDEFEVPKLGRKPEMGVEAEDELERYLVLRQEFGFGLTRTELRCLAFDFMEKLGVDHRFSKSNKMAGWEWMYSFLKRHPKLTVRKEENLSINRALGMNRSSVNKFFEILENKMSELNLRNKPDKIFNADESGLQMNTRGSYVLCQKGKKNVHSISPKEKGETVTVLACCNATGNFMPPSVIFKGKRLQVEYQGQLPPGSYVYTSDSGYINSEIFFKFIKQFISFFKISRATPAILVVDGHDSHSRDIDMLQHCVENGLSLLCLPPHTTHWLQPTDRSFFKPLKKYFYEEAAVFVRNHGRSFTKIEFCSIMCKAWMKSATAGNAVSGFRATGIWPLNVGEIPESAYIGDSLSNSDPNSTTRPLNEMPSSSNPGPSSRPTLPSTTRSINHPPSRNADHISATDRNSTTHPLNEIYSSPNPGTSSRPMLPSSNEPVSRNAQHVRVAHQNSTTRPLNEMSSSPNPGPSSRPTLPSSLSSLSEPLSRNADRVRAAHGSSSCTSKSSQTVASLFEELSPVPKLKTTSSNRGRRKNIARELTSAESLASAKKRVATGGSRGGLGAKRKVTRNITDPKDSCICPVCGANYYDENQGQKWVQCCGTCSLWFHEECIELEGNSFYCDDCSE